ncbi:MAG: excinuclease ABC subunit C [Gemmatimonadetes bacterium GWC2_71_9]|nr:MAG: excinuclease ABC subunit C [Gemmatimonadetes bacterium RIFCSPLOWO2_02_FULL_71_11]OGT95183.1 MAG: excinuclease ABC subunit C [Gemmatimonadetes bacterium GWC2_71_9]
MTDDALQRKLEGLPDAPGVYLWKDAEGTVLYVGKAKSLRARVRWYFGDDVEANPRLMLLRKHIADLETIVLKSEAQALLLENNLIKEHLPRYNVNLRDDKRYPWLAVTLQEPFARILVTRQAADDGARYFGPYTDVGALRQTLRVIRRIFTVRSCHYALPGEAPERPCLDFHIGKCRAPCVGLESREEYRRMIQDVILFLEGKTLEVRTRLRERMQQAATDLDFELAAELRDGLARLDQIEEPQTVERVGGGNCDAVALARDEDDACAVVMRIREGKVIGREHTFLVGVEGVPEGDVLTAFLVRYYLPRPWRARLAVLPCPPADEDALREAFGDAQYAVPQRGLYRRLADLADQNAIHLLETLRLETFEGAERAEDPVYALGRDLGLAAVPRTLVCADISTAQGRDTVGSTVWFENGRPKRGEYRTYRMKTIEGQDDFASMKEMVGRFLARRLVEAKPLPDLFVVDGGKGQLNAALEAAQQAGVTALPFASLAKRDEAVFLPGRSEPLRLSRRSPSLRLLQRARDEAHRVAVTFNRKRRTARTITSALLEIPGVGPSRRRALLQRLGSLAGVKSASVEELKQIPGISDAMAQRIFEHVHRTD